MCTRLPQLLMRTQRSVGNEGARETKIKFETPNFDGKAVCQQMLHSHKYWTATEQEPRPPMKEWWKEWLQHKINTHSIFHFPFATRSFYSIQSRSLCHSRFLFLYLIRLCTTHTHTHALYNTSSDFISSSSLFFCSAVFCFINTD